MRYSFGKIEICIIMKIAFDAKGAYCNSSGLGNYSRNIINALCSYYPDNKYVLYTPQLREFYKSRLVSNSIEKIVTPSGAWKLAKPIWRSISMGDFIDNDAAVYHGLSNELPLNINNRKLLKIVTIHDVIFMRYPELYSLFDIGVYKAKTQHACDNADIVVAVSKQTKEDLLKYFKVDENKIKVIYQPCNEIFTKPVSNEQIIKVRKKFNLPENYILFVGNIEERKNVLQVVKAIYQNNIDVPMIIIGKKTDYLKKIYRYINKNSVKNIIVLHNVETEELPVFYSLADIFVFPSLFEGFGIPIIESLNCGTPVITNKDGCLREAAGDGAVYVNVMDVDEIASAILSIYSDCELHDKLVKAGKAYVANFTSQKVASELMSLYANN